MKQRRRLLVSALVVAVSALSSCSSTDDAAPAEVSGVSDPAPTTAEITVDSMVPESMASDTTVVDQVARISVTVGVDSSPDRVEEVSLGREVALTLSNPGADDEFHLHGYDLGGGVTKKGEAKTFTFTATEAGEFELESHVTGDVLVVVKVS